MDLHQELTDIYYSKAFPPHNSHLNLLQQIYKVFIKFIEVSKNINVNFKDFVSSKSKKQQQKKTFYTFKPSFNGLNSNICGLAKSFIAKKK